MYLFSVACCIIPRFCSFILFAVYADTIGWITVGSVFGIHLIVAFVIITAEIKPLLKGTVYFWSKYLYYFLFSYVYFFLYLNLGHHKNEDTENKYANSSANTFANAVADGVANANATGNGVANDNANSNGDANDNANSNGVANDDSYGVALDIGNRDANAVNKGTAKQSSGSCFERFFRNKNTRYRMLALYATNHVENHVLAIILCFAPWSSVPMATRYVLVLVPVCCLLQPVFLTLYYKLFHSKTLGTYRGCLENKTCPFSFLKKCQKLV